MLYVFLRRYFSYIFCVFLLPLNISYAQSDSLLIKKDLEDCGIDQLYNLLKLRGKTLFPIENETVLANIPIEISPDSVNILRKYNTTNLKVALDSLNWSTITPQQIIVPHRQEREVERPSNNNLSDEDRKLLEKFQGYSSEMIFQKLREKQLSIWGTDDRKDYFEINNEDVISNANTVVAFFDKNDFYENIDGSYSYQFAVSRLGDKLGLCNGEKFMRQPCLCSCTGFAISDSTIATAGHCIKDPKKLKDFIFVFGYTQIDKENCILKFKKVDVLKPIKIIAQTFDTSDLSKPDYMIIKVNKTIPKFRIANRSTQTKIANKQKIYVIGHPLGLPLKYADGANVLDNTHATIFTANLDTYGGNSGSPVFNSETNLVEGILIGGDRDFINICYNKGDSCKKSMICPNKDCKGEIVTRISNLKLIK